MGGTDVRNCLLMTVATAQNALAKTSEMRGKKIADLNATLALR